MNNLVKLSEILNSKQKNQTIILSFLLLSMSVFEIFFLHSIYIVINIISEKNINFNLGFIELTSLGEKLIDHKILVLSIFLIFFFIKTIFNILVLRYESNYLYRTREKLSNEFFLKYINLPKLLHVKISIANLLKKIIIEVDNLTVVLRSLSTIFLETSVLLLISVYLFFINFYLALFLFLIFTISSLVVLKINKQKIMEIGKEQLENNEMRIKIVNEILSSLKSFRNLKFKESSTRKYFFYNKRANDNAIMIALKNNYIRPIFELIILTIAVSALLFLFFKSFELKDFFSEFTVFLAASYRLMPSYARILSSYQSYKFNIQTIDEYYNDKISLFNSNKSENNLDSKEINFQNLIFFKNINFSYLNKISRKNTILKNINFKIVKGSKIVVIGESGSGKTTLLELLMGLSKPLSGKIFIDGNEQNLSNLSWQEKIGYVPQNIFITSESLKKNIGFGYEDNEIDIEKVSECINFCNLNNFVESLPNGINTKLKDLGLNISGGQKQRIGLARALYNNPEILILDEPTSNLDEKNEVEIIQKLLKIKNVTLIITSHKKNLLLNFDQIFELYNSSLRAKKNESK
jgi:ABC-type multidrug transport system fused ATPase/permease subunit